MTQQAIQQPEFLTIDAIFDQLCASRPDRIAIVTPHLKWTYAELAEASFALEDWLRRKSAAKGDRLAILLPRGPEHIALIIAGLRLGMTIAPLDTGMPALRRAAVLALLAPAITVDIETLSQLSSEIARAAGGDRNGATGDHGPFDCAFVFFTSGSTGVPKGIEVPHLAISVLMHDPDFVPCDHDTRMAHLANPAFDALSFDLWAGLLNGGSVAIFDHDEALDPDRFALRVYESKCTTAFMTSSLFNLMVERAPHAIAMMRHVVVGGEAFDPHAVQRLYASQPAAGVQLYNGYGPTEFATFAVTYRVDRNLLDSYIAQGRIPIGTPVRGTQAIIDEETGELLLAGPRMALGYLNNPDETRRRFRQHRHGARLLVRVYATGDRVQQTTGGAIEFLGRLDEQIKIRGHRVEMDEVLVHVLRQPGVRDAIILPLTMPDGTTALGACLRLEPGMPIDAVRHRLTAELPHYMIPAVFREIDDVPLNANGKVDRRQLLTLLARAEDGSTPAGDAPTAAGMSAQVAALQTALAKHVGSAWDPARSFVENGGTSLAAVRVAFDIAESLKIQCRFVDLIQDRPLYDIAAELSSRQSREMLNNLDPTAAYPATSEQERLYFLRRMAPASDAYNAVFCFEVPQLSVETLQQALAFVQGKHPLLGARFTLGDALIIHPDAAAQVDCVVLEQGDRRDPRQLALQPFDPATPGTWRVIYDKRTMNGLLWLAIDHLAVDSWSMAILLADLSEAYAAARYATLDPPTPLAGHADYSRMRDDERRSSQYLSQIASWRADLAALTVRNVAQLDVGRRRYPRPGRRIEDRLTVEQSNALSMHATQSDNTPFVSLMAIWAWAVGTTFMHERVAIGFPVSRRGSSDQGRSVGLFAETLLARLAIGRDFQSTHARMKSELADVFDRHLVSYADIAGQANGARGDQLFDSMLVLEDLPLDNLHIDAMHCSGRVVATDDVKFPLTLFVRPLADTVELDLEFDPEVVKPDVADQLLATVKQTVAALIHAPEPAPHHIPALASILDFQRWPPRQLAIVDQHSTLTYQNLEADIQRRCAALAATTVCGQRIGILAEPTPTAIASILAILRTGRVYVPLDRTLPLPRLQNMVSAAGLTVTFCDDADWAMAHALGLEPILAPPTSGAGIRPDAGTAGRVTDDAPAYILFTSGSTGNPKGVEVPRSALANYLSFAGKTYYPMRTKGVVSTALSFDATLTTLLAPFAVGATVELVPSGPLGLPQLAKLIRQPTPAVFKVTPAHLSILAAYLAPHGPVTSNHCLVVGGEALTETTLKAFQGACPNATIINEYGPTETTVGCTWHDLTDHGHGAVPIGRPIDNMQINIVSDNLQPLPNGERGEILISGAGVATGYLDDGALTDRRFVAWSANGAKTRAYRSGDVGYRDKDGILHFAGRHDDQIKIRGHRVELGDIEAALRCAPSVENAAVSVAPGLADQSIVAAFITPEQGLPAQQLRQYLAGHVPAHMIPDRIIRLDDLPLTNNHKIDKKALLQMLADDQQSVIGHSPK